MKSIIRNILLEKVVNKTNYLKINDSKIGNAIRGHLDEDITWGDLDYEMEEMAEKYAIPAEYIKFITFKYIIDNGYNPEDEYPLHVWLYKVTDTMAFIKDSGFYDEYVDITRFSDIDIKDGRVYFYATSWYDFKDLFDNKYVAEQLLSEDWAELYDAWDTDLTEIFDTLNDRGIKIIQDFIIDSVTEITEIGHREEFDYMTGDVGSDNEGVITISDNVDNIRSINDTYNLMLLVDEGEFLEKDDLISNLKSAYNNAYNGVAEDELFQEMKKEIERHLGGEGKWKKKVLMFDVTNKIYDYIDKYIDYLNSNPTTEHSDFMGVWYDLSKDINDYGLDTPRVDYFYPDNDKLVEWFNEILVDHIYL